MSSEAIITEAIEIIQSNPAKAESIVSWNNFGKLKSKIKEQFPRLERQILELILSMLNIESMTNGDLEDALVVLSELSDAISKHKNRTAGTVL